MTPTTRKALEMAQEYFTEYSGYRSEDVAKAVAKALAEPTCTACGGTKTVYGGEVCKFCDEPVPRRLPEGWKLVPVEPTPEMLSDCGMMNGYDPHSHHASPDADHVKWYQDMLAAAPECKP